MSNCPRDVHTPKMSTTHHVDLRVERTDWLIQSILEVCSKWTQKQKKRPLAVSLTRGLHPFPTDTSNPLIEGAVSGIRDTDLDSTATLDHLREACRKTWG